MNSSSTKTGHEGEELASTMLIEKGYEIIQRNYRHGNTGEIDVVAMDGKVLVFVEVKYRQNLNYGDPEYGITRNKICQVRKMAAAYLYDKKISNVNCRFDVVAILELVKGKPVINHYQNAF